MTTTLYVDQRWTTRWTDGRRALRIAQEQFSTLQVVAIRQNEEEDSIPLVTAVTGGPRLHTFQFENRGSLPWDCPLEFYYLALQNLALSTPNLQTLEFCDFHLLQETFAAPLFHALANNNHLKKLSLTSVAGRHHIASTAIGEAVAVLLRSNTCLETLFLCIRGKLVFGVLEALKTNHSLKHFSCFMPPQDQARKDDIQEALIAVVKDHNYTLEQFRGLLQAKDEHVLIFYLELNKIGRKKLLQDVNATTREEWIQMLFRCQRDPRQLFYFLSSNPSLLCRDINFGALVEQEKKKKKRSKFARGGALLGFVQQHLLRRRR